MTRKQQFANFIYKLDHWFFSVPVALFFLGFFIHIPFWQPFWEIIGLINWIIACWAIFNRY